ncbi:MAG: 4Fe-4S binding protein [Elusimicrobia bacterium]|nr:4Fe-4S binding protein [Elusimicrobiota bacterium]
MMWPGAMLKEVLCSLFKKPATHNYPFVKIAKPEAFRGKLNFFSDKCIGCKICMRDCPSNAIIIHKIADKQFEAEIRLDKCVYCAQCVESCPKKALEATHDFELASLSQDSLRVIIK